MGEIEKAQLIFLDSIERNQAEVARALQGQPEALRELIGAATSELRLAMLAVAEAIGKIPQPAKPDPPQSLMPVLEALGALANALVMQTNKVMAEMVRQADRLASPPPKKWRFNIDRNYQTGRIQEVTAEVVDGV